MKKFVYVIFVASFFLGNVSAQEKSKVQYSDLVIVQYSFLNGIMLNYQGIFSDTQFGVNQKMKDIFYKEEESRKEFDIFSKKKTTGLIMAFGGIGIELSGLAYELTMINQNQLTLDKAKISLGIAGAGFLIAIIGTIIDSGSYTNLLNAVNEYNQKQFK
jgi:hypothetical protein